MISWDDPRVKSVVKVTGPRGPIYMLQLPGEPDTPLSAPTLEARDHLDRLAKATKKRKGRTVSSPGPADPRAHEGYHGRGPDAKRFQEKLRRALNGNP